MPDLQPYQQAGFNLLPRDARQGGRALSRASSRGLVRTGSVDIETDVTMAKTGSVTAVTGAMMGDVVRVAQAQRQLELMAPEASGRLAMIADNHVLGLMEVDADHRRSLRRI